MTHAGEKLRLEFGQFERGIPRQTQLLLGGETLFGLDAQAFHGFLERVRALADAVFEAVFRCLQCPVGGIEFPASLLEDRFGPAARLTLAHARLLSALHAAHAGFSFRGPKYRVRMG